MTSQERILDNPAPAPPADRRIPCGPGEHCFGDLRVPAGAGPWPVAIVIHGGFWRTRRTLGYIAPACAALTAHGYATWNLEYRRIGHAGGGWPGTCEDIARGAALLSEIAGPHHLDLERVIAVGHSAGGHLALWLATVRLLRGVVSLAGVTDLRRAWELGLGDGAAAEFMGGTPEVLRAAYGAASPIEHLPLGVPSRLVHGTADDRVPFEISARFAERAIAAGDDCELIELPGAGHIEPVDPWSREWPLVVSAIDSLNFTERSGKPLRIPGSI